MFTLDQRLQADCVQIGRFPLCQLMLMNDARYAWFILVPRRREVSEIFELDEADQQLLWSEVGRFAAVVKGCFAADKMNVATLGNVVNQLHLHVIARTRADSAWPGPVWGHSPAIPYSAEAVAGVIEKLRVVLGSEFEFAGELS